MTTTFRKVSSFISLIRSSSAPSQSQSQDALSFHSRQSHLTRKRGCRDSNSRVMSVQETGMIFFVWPPDHQLPPGPPAIGRPTDSSPPCSWTRPGCPIECHPALAQLSSTFSLLGTSLLRLKPGADPGQSWQSPKLHKEGKRSHACLRLQRVLVVTRTPPFLKSYIRPCRPRASSVYRCKVAFSPWAALANVILSPLLVPALCTLSAPDRQGSYLQPGEHVLVPCGFCILCVMHPYHGAT